MPPQSGLGGSIMLQAPSPCAADRAATHDRLVRRPITRRYFVKDGGK